MSNKKTPLATPLDPAFVRHRLRGPSPLVARNRRLVSVPRDTYRKLQTTAKALSEELGFVVYPLQVAALIVERGA